MPTLGIPLTETKVNPIWISTGFLFCFMTLTKLVRTGFPLPPDFLIALVRAAGQGKKTWFSNDPSRKKGKNKRKTVKTGNSLRIL